MTTTYRHTVCHMKLTVLQHFVGGASGGTQCQRRSFLIRRNVLVALTLILGQRGSAQVDGATQQKLLSRTPRCVVCAMSLDTVGVLRANPTAAYKPGDVPSSIDMNARGEYFLTFEGSDHRVMVFDTMGRFKAAVGSPMSGPERPGVLRIFIDTDDTLFVFDSKLARISVYAPDLHLVRANTIERLIVHRAARLMDGDLLVAADFLTPEGVGFPLHRVSAEGTVRESFGSADTAYAPAGVGESKHVLSRGPDGGVWSSPQATLHLRRWTARGTLIEEFKFEGGRPASWNRQSGLKEFGFVKPTGFDLGSDLCRRLVIGSHVPAEVPWGEPGLKAVPVAGRGSVLKAKSPDRTFVTVLDVIDPASSTYLASYQVPVNLLRVFPDGSAITGATDDSGLWHLAIVRLHGRLPGGAFGGAPVPGARGLSCSV